jgi:hypothetical protein
MTRDPRRLRPDHLPTPFTADEIRAGCRPGRTVRLLVDQGEGAPFVRVTRYVTADEQGTDQESWLETPEGERTTQPERWRSSWLELQEHASFPSASTDVAEEEIAVGPGRFSCLRYTATEDGIVRRFWFARDFPGMPIRVELREGDSVQSSFALLENLPGR